MSFFVKSTPAPRPKTSNIRLISVSLAAIFVIFAVAQLFEFEDFPAVMASFWLPGGETTAKLLAALFVTCEVLAIPFLLSMRLSPAMRVCSMVAGWLAIGGWLFLAIWATVTVNVIASIGVFGSLVTLPVGWWAVFFFAALGLLAGWTSWGMWPLRHTKAK